MRGGLSADSLLQRPVCLRGIRLGHATDVLLERTELRAIGLWVRCGDEAERYLPLPAARIEEDSIELGSVLQLLDAQDLAFFEGRATTLRALRGLAVEREGRAAGTLADLLLAPDGMVLGVVVEASGSRASIPLGDGVTVGGRRIASAA